MPSSTTSTTSQVDFVIVTALEKEAKAVVKLLKNHDVKRYEERDIRTYHTGTIPIQNTKRAYRVVVVLLPSMGEIPAATAITDAVTFWKPHFVFMVGIAGGIPQDDLDLGDVVVADQIIGYDYGKVTKKTIKPRERVYPASAFLLDRIRNFWDKKWAQQIQTPRPQNASRPISKRFVGPIASGNKVIASTHFRNQLLSRWSKLVAVETESEGVYAAVFDRPQILGTLVVRGICDMADKRKGDEWQEYAADAAATFLIHFLKSGPVEQVVADLKTNSKLGPDKISLAKLPSTSPDLFGRDDRLKELDDAWEIPKINVVSLVAWGGVGKSALVNKWLLQMAADNYRGAQRVYGWSFYSQGAAEGRQVSTDPFIAAALTWFGDPTIAGSNASAWDKGERLAELIRAQRTLLILDGLESLQNPPQGEIRDRSSGLVSLLRELARQNPGLAIISTRLAVDDLKDFIGSTALEIDLENLSPAAGAACLAHFGVDGADAEREEASRDFGGHALALTLLGRYLKVVHGGDICMHKEIPHVMDEQKQGAHARRVMASYEHWLEGKSELEILRLMGLFDRPAEKGALEALRKEPAIQRLTDTLQKLKDADWKYAINNLRNLRLIAQEDPHEPDTLDCHPLLREHFGEKLKAENPEAWREAHGRLYEYYKAAAKEFPDTIEEMAPLFVAVLHGCQAGRHHEALNEVYWRRIQRGELHLNWKKICPFDADLFALSGFFDPPWRKPVDGLSEADKGYVLNEAGFNLRALGRLAEAAQLTRLSQDAAIEQYAWRNASPESSNLSGLYLTMGDLKEARDYASQSVELADRSGDVFERMRNRTTFADALQQAGRLAEAEAKFREAEEIQKQRQPELPLLYSLQGYQYCDLLLSQGKYEEVQHRAVQTLGWAKQYLGLLDVALDHLSLGRALTLTLPSPYKGEGTDAATYLNRAVDGLRQAAHQEFITRGLLARAEFHRLTGALEKAQKDLDEAFSIASRGEMGLFVADCHLEYARLALARGRGDGNGKGAAMLRPYNDEAREHLKTAKEMIAKMGYHRRDKEVEELEKQLE